MLDTSPIYFTKRLILMSGDEAAQSALADRLSEINPKLAVFSLGAPVFDALMAFTGATSEELEPSEPFEKSQLLTNRMAFDHTDRFIRATFGEEFLARRAMQTLEEVSSFTDCYIITDLKTLHDFLPFIRAFPPDELLHISIGEVGPVTSVETLHIDTPDETTLRAVLRVISPKPTERIEDYHGHD